MIRKPYLFTLIALLTIVITVGGATARPTLMTTALKSAFTHQGRLEKNGTPFTGTCNMQFTLFDAVSGGSQVGNTQTKTGVAVSNGLFSAQLDFGPAVFSGSDRYLEIAVDCSDGFFTTLSPRQTLTSSPYAIHSTSAEQLVKEFVVAPSENIITGDVVSFLGHGQVVKGNGFGSETVFNTSPTTEISTAALSDNQFVIAYKDGANSGFGTAAIGTVSGNTISFGPKFVFNTDLTHNTSIAALSPTEFVVLYNDGNPQLGTAVVGTASGNTITFGPEAVFRNAGSYQLSAVALSSTQFVIMYDGVASVGSVTSNTVTFGPEAGFGQGLFSAAALSNTQFVVVYDEVSSVIGTVAGNTIAFGPANSLPGSGPNAMSVAALSPTQFVVAYRHSNLSDYGVAVIGRVSGNSVTYGSQVVFNGAFTNWMSVAALSSERFVIAYTDYPQNPIGLIIFGTSFGNTIKFGPPAIFNSESTDYVSVAALSPTQFVIGYRDTSNSEFGTAIIGPDWELPVGIAKSSASGGESVPVIIGGVSDVHSALSVGVTYYAQPDGSLTPNANAQLVGLDISPSELLLQVGGK